MNEIFTNTHSQQTGSHVHEALVIDKELRALVAAACKEDFGGGDVTTLAAIANDQTGQAQVITKADGTLCGLPLFLETYRQIDKSLEIQCRLSEGRVLTASTPVLTVSGSMQSILTGERVALNWLGLLSGVATLTADYVRAVRQTKAQIIDTRKTIPLLRRLQKYAVRIGGGSNHRMGLYDMVLIKDNHIDSCGGITQAVQAAREKWGDKYPIEVETRNLDEVREAVETGVDRMMLDNMSLETMREAVAIINGRCETEASGGVNLQTVTSIAECGVDYISVGALTHSLRCMDFSMQIK